jgi:acetoin utilization protein AcuC
VKRLCVVHGEELGAYGFPHSHPFGPDRLATFWAAMVEQGLDASVIQLAPAQADREALERFHTPEYVDRVIELSRRGRGLLDQGDTPAFPGCYEAAATVVGSGLHALEQIVQGRADRAFVAVGGLHHARRDRAGGFCIFNDCGVLIETLKSSYGIRPIGYVDIDAHHGDGVYYDFICDPDVVVVDIHEDGRFLYPGTGSAREAGEGDAVGTKLNLPLPPGAEDEAFDEVWARAEPFLDRACPKFFIFQCGADSVQGDPLTHLCLSPAAHLRAARALARLSNEHARGRILALGGGGYDRSNLARTWTAVARALLEE